MCTVPGERSVFTPVCVCGTVPGCSALHAPESGHSPSRADPGSLVPRPLVEITEDGEEAGIAKSWSIEGF